MFALKLIQKKRGKTSITCLSITLKQSETLHLQNGLWDWNQAYKFNNLILFYSYEYTTHCWQFLTASYVCWHVRKLQLVVNFPTSKRQSRISADPWGHPQENRNIRTFTVMFLKHWNWWLTFSIQFKELYWIKSFDMSVIWQLAS